MVRTEHETFIHERDSTCTFWERGEVQYGSVRIPSLTLGATMVLGKSGRIAYGAVSDEAGKVGSAEKWW